MDFCHSVFTLDLWVKVQSSGMTQKKNLLLIAETRGTHLSPPLPLSPSLAEFIAAYL